MFFTLSTFFLTAMLACVHALSESMLAGSMKTNFLSLTVGIHIHVIVVHLNSVEYII